MSSHDHIKFKEEKYPYPDHLVESAKKILTNGNPMDFFLNVFHRNHVGNDHICAILSYVFGASSIANCIEGMHIYVSGTSGSGKSTAIKAMYEQLPKIYQIEGRLSDQFLYYAGETYKPEGDNKNALIRPGTIIYIDEREFSSQLQDIFKLSVTNWLKGITSRTLVQQELKILNIPPKVAWIISKVDLPGNDEVMSRLCHCRVDESEDNRKLVSKHITSTYQVSQKVVNDNYHDDLEICKIIWSILKQNLIIVNIPFADKIVYRRGIQHRDQRRILDIIAANAAINRYQRPLIGYDNNIAIIEANMDDYGYCRPIIIELLKHGDHTLHLISHEEKLLNILRQMTPKGWVFTLNQVVEYSKTIHSPMKKVEIRRALEGRRDIPNNVGLIGKCTFIQRISKEELDITEWRGNQIMYHIDLVELEDFFSGEALFELERPSLFEITHENQKITEK